MLESLAMHTTRYADPDGPIDPGILAEAMLYYGNVTVYSNRSDLQQLLRVMGPDLLLEYLSQGFMRIVYVENFLGIRTDAAGTSKERYSPQIAEMPHVALQHYAPEAFIEAVGRLGRGRRLARRFETLASTYRYDPLITAAVGQDLADSNYTTSCVDFLLRLHAPEYHIPQPLIFKVDQDGRGYSVATNIDFAAVNKVYHGRIPATHSTMNPALLLALLAEVNGSLELASTAGGDIATNDAFSGLLERKVQGILKKRMAEQRQLAEFNSYLFKNAIALQQVINSGQRTFRDLLPLLKKSRRLREWIVREIQPDQKLLDEYIFELRDQSWLDRLPSKTIRWGVMSGIGLTLDVAGAGGVGVLSALGLSAFDALLLDRLVKGWKPTQFIEGDLARFVRTEDSDRRAG